MFPADIQSKSVKCCSHKYYAHIKTMWRELLPFGAHALSTIILSSNLSYRELLFLQYNNAQISRHMCNCLYSAGFIAGV